MRRLLFFISIFTLLAGLYAFLPQLPLWSWFHQSPSDYDKLLLENEGLKAELLSLILRQAQDKSLKENNNKYLVAKIYSTYPFNDKNIFTINVGNKDGIEEGDAVLAEKGILLGKIVKVFNNYSEVKSIFSPDWQLSVKIGEKGNDGLLMGDPDPQITMIIGDKEIKVGEDIYSASKEFAYGLKIGKVKTIKSGANSFFKESSIELPYKFNNLLEVLVTKS